MRRVTYDEEGIRAKFGVAPESIPDYLALVGDSSDGYPGLPGWGAKSAAAVLSRWIHLEDIPDSPLEWDLALRGASSLAATLRDHREEAALYKRLATLNRDAAVEEQLDDLEWHGVHRDDFTALCAELGFETVGSRVHRWA
jgi:5'-3' exonuclease